MVFVNYRIYCLTDSADSVVISSDGSPTSEGTQNSPVSMNISPQKVPSISSLCTSESTSTSGDSFEGTGSNVHVLSMYNY